MVGPQQPSQGDDDEGGFAPDQLDRMVITPPLLFQLQDPANDANHYDVIIDINLDYPRGREAARARVMELIGKYEAGAPVRPGGSGPTPPYLFAHLSGAAIKGIVAEDRSDPDTAAESTFSGLPMMRGAIYRIWEDSEIRALITRSIATVKADAAQTSYSAFGADVTWAVVDSGIDSEHIHFRANQTLSPPKPVAHRDFVAGNSPLTDEFGHGTHVAGIIAGHFNASEYEGKDAEKWAVSRIRDEQGKVRAEQIPITKISGMAPKCKLVSMKVLGPDGRGRVSMVIDALQEIQRVNDYGRRLLIHGVNLSVGYDFDPEWFACGQSPMCVEVDRLVRSGVVVVVAAGNTGYGWLQTQEKGAAPAGLPMSINDPGNADLAITVGSTHRDMPYTYGVSYFSSKGPTGDGRMKPDLVAPGERIISCAAGQKKASVNGSVVPDYVEDSGTSMAAPHVSGVIAAFLSIRREFVGQPDRVKEIFVSTASDLRRERSFQGAGLVDLMRAIQSV